MTAPRPSASPAATWSRNAPRALRQPKTLQLQIVDHEQYTYLGSVLQSGSDKSAISNLTSAGKHALFAMQCQCSDLGTAALFSLFFTCTTCFLVWL